MPSVSPLRTTDTGINGEHQHWHVRQIAALKQFHQCRQVGKGRGAHAKTLEVFGAVSLHAIGDLAARLLGARYELTIGIARHLDRNFACGHPGDGLANEIDGLK